GSITAEPWYASGCTGLIFLVIPRPYLNTLSVNYRDGTEHVAIGVSIYLFEEQQGKSYALNGAIREARGEILSLCGRRIQRIGERVWDVKVTPRHSCAKMAVVVLVTDESHYEVFNASTERLGCGAPA